MPARSLLARWFLMGGVALGGLGLVLWHLLPIPLEYPPYATTALLALVYGVVCLVPRRPASRRKS